MDRSDMTLGEDLTIAYSRIICVGWMYPFHMLGAYLLVVTGIGAFITRIVPQYKKWHATFGRAFMLTMYWTYGTSLIIRTAGLSLAIVLFLFTKLIGLTVGWLAIAKHRDQRHAELMKRVNAALKADYAASKPPRTIEEMMAAERKVMESEKGSFKSRFFTYKALHGVAMSYAWYTMTGRVLVTNPATAWEGCFTYPAFKTLDGEIEYLPREEPGFRDFNGELAFFFGIAFLGMFIINAVALVYSWRTAKRTRLAHPDTTNKQQELSPVASVKKLDDSESSESSEQISELGGGSSADIKGLKRVTTNAVPPSPHERSREVRVYTRT